MFGAFQLQAGSRLLQPFATQKAKSLFGYLVTHAGREHSRESLAEMLWPERPPANARRSLHTALWQIRSNFKENGLDPDEILDVAGANVSWIEAPDKWLDVSEFEQACALDQPDRLEGAIRLYRGPFLENIYDDWCIESRYQLELKYCWALERLAQTYYSTGNFQPALDTALRLVHTNPLREDAHALVMQAYYQLGNRPAAIAQYAALQNILFEQLRIGTSNETRALYEMILSETLPVRHATGSFRIDNHMQPRRVVENQPIERLLLARPCAGVTRARLEAVLRQGKAIIENIPGVEWVSVGIAASPGPAYPCFVRIVFRNFQTIQAYESNPYKTAYDRDVWRPSIAEQVVTDYILSEQGPGFFPEN